MKILTEDFYKEGYKLSMSSAKALLKIANKSAEMKEYGIARSLTILSAEEAVKGIIILNHPFVKEEYTGWQEIFKSHSKKHEYISNVIKINYCLTKSIETTNKGKPISEKKLQHLKSINKLAFDTYQWWKKQKDNPLVFEETLKWWDSANQEKNKGFYVDKGSTEWHNPRKYTCKQFMEAKKYTKVLIELAEFMEITYNDIGVKEFMEKPSDFKDKYLEDFYKEYIKLIPL